MKVFAGRADEDDLAAQLTTLRDKNAIQEHTAEYNESWDDGRLVDWVSTWTPTGRFVLPGAPDTVGYESLLTMVTAMQVVGFVHVSVNPRIEVTGDIARQRCYAILARRDASRRFGTSTWLTTGRYTDELVRTPTGWRFAVRTFVPDASLRDLPQWW